MVLSHDTSSCSCILVALPPGSECGACVTRVFRCHCMLKCRRGFWVRCMRRLYALLSVPRNPVAFASARHVNLLLHRRDIATCIVINSLCHVWL